MLSISKEDNKSAKQLVTKVKSIVDVKTEVNGRLILKGAQLPLIQTDKNEVYKGVSGVREFVTVELARRRGI
ncbi:MAG: hypothetical protein KKD69_06585 [Euryarchaeota archaeon]|nr:hypothetical protein [Euryarchaeota archaeon]